MDRISVIEFQGFKDGDNNFIIKELFIIHDLERESWLFKPPYDKNVFNRKTMKNIKWCKKNLHGFDWDDGTLSYEYLEVIIRYRCWDKPIVVTKGLEKAKFLEKILNRPVLDLNYVLLTRMNKLPKPSVECNYLHVGSCAKINAYKLFYWMQDVSKLFE